MNKAITDGLLFMPPAFANGLDVWSSENGTPGSATYQGAANAAFAPSDQDFGGCLEMQKTQATQKLRYMGETPYLPGCYLRVTARVKAISGNLPSVRIAAWAGGAGGVAVGGLTLTGPSVALTAYGQVVTVSAIIGSGIRGGVNMVWGTTPIYGHFGLDLTGANSGVVRIDDIIIEDITGAYLRDYLDWVDVRDFGAKGDGIANDSAAFEAADTVAAATGKTVLVSKGTYYLGSHVTFEAPARFEGTVTMPDAQRLSLTRNFDLPSYAAAFGDEVTGFKKAFQALVNYSDHDSLDFKGRRIDVTAPIDMAAVAGKTVYSIRRVISNGTIGAIDGPAWTPDVVTSQATYNPAAEKTLTAVANVANIAVGSLVTGTGVGREIYVTEKNVGAATVTLSQPLYDAVGTQVLTFTRFKYILDFSGFTKLDKMHLDNLELQCDGAASGILLAPSGVIFQMRDCLINKPRNRGITSIGNGCQGMLIDRCQFLSNESGTLSQDRISIALNVNANDNKIRDNRFAQFRHSLVMAGSNHIIVGNHMFQGDEAANGLRLAGIALCETSPNCTVSGNYIDNCFVEWTNEYQSAPAFSTGLSFGALTITANVFLAGGVAPWFAWIVVKPYGPGHFIQGMNVSGNGFKTFHGSVDRIERVDTALSVLDYSRFRNITFEGNSFTRVTQVTASPVFIEHSQVTAATVWTINPGPFLPFGGWARNVESVVTEGMITGSSGERRSDLPFVTVEQGVLKQEIKLNWAATSKGLVQVKVRVDNPN